jgi:hypothetical protein
LHGIVARFGLYTSAKTIPASVLCEHKNQVDTFHRQFQKIEEKSPRNNGYASEDDKHLIKFKNQRVQKDFQSSTAVET